MKKTFLSVILLCNIIMLAFFLSSYNSERKKADPPQLYIVEYAKGSAWEAKKDFEEQKYANQHSDYMQHLRKEGIIQFGARYADKGIIFISAMGMENAKHIVNSDTAVMNNMFSATINDLNIFYEYKITK